VPAASFYRANKIAGLMGTEEPVDVEHVLWFNTRDIATQTLINLYKLGNDEGCWTRDECLHGAIVNAVQ
jgi:hypothetical protein